jgi:plastocyanin
MLRFTTVAVVISAIVLAGIGLAKPFATRAASAAVSIGDGSFGPAALTIAVGDTVTWTNNDDSPHTVTAENGPFDSGNVDPGGTFTFTFTQAGTYGYVCRYHGEMRATIIVTAPPDAGVGDVTAVNETEDPVESQSDQPDTAVPAPRAPTVWVPGLLIGLGLVAFAFAVVPARPRSARRTAQPARASEEWRR